LETENLMVRLRPAKLVHRGTVLSEAFLLPGNFLSETEMHQRILAHWQAGERIFRRGDDLIVILREPMRVNPVKSFGLPFVRYGKSLLSAFPLKKGEVEQFRSFGDCLIHFAAGRMEVIRPEELTTESVESWFDVSEFKLIATKSLGRPEPAPVHVLEPISDEDLKLRDELKTVPSADPQLKCILAELKRLGLGKNNEQVSPFYSGSSGNRGTGALANFVASTLGSLKKLFAINQSHSGSADKGKEFGAPNFGPLESGPFSRLYDHLHRLVVQTVVEMRIGRVLGRRQAKYLAEMMEKFERGDLDEALKSAIPLADMESLAELMRNRPAFFLPRPRNSLQISPQAGTGGPTITLEADWFRHLRTLYRQSFERLESQGRYEEAAFVLAELLKSNAEAVDFLSKHGKYRLAAELAEARGLPKETAVRQWFLAGEKVRAVRLAILHNCFEYAVDKLEQKDPEMGAELREIWAESLARAGNFSAAAEVIWSVEARRGRARDWIEQAIGFGGVAGARALVKKAILCPHEFDDIKEKFQKLLSGDDSEAVEVRNALAREVPKREINHELRVLLRPLVRKALSDAQGTSHGLTSAEFRDLVSVCNDRALRADMPAFPQLIRPLDESKAAQEIVIPADDRGSSTISDACYLPGGKIAVALGESGVKLLSRQGKAIAYFDQPAHELILSDSGSRAIAAALRGDTTRLSRIEFAERRSSFWCNAGRGVFAPTFDGNIWFGGFGEDFYAFDSNGSRLDAIWQVTEVAGTIHGVVRSPTNVTFQTASEVGFETWCYELPSLTLRSRTRWPLDKIGEGMSVYSAGISTGTHAILILERQAENSERFNFLASFLDGDRIVGEFEFPPETLGVRPPTSSNPYSAIVAYSDDGAAVFLFANPGRYITTIKLAAAKDVSTKLVKNLLTIADDRGRVLVFDYKSRTLVLNVRV
jgi:hypothetical protein